MNIQSSQIQLKISLSEQLNDLLESKASNLGVPVTQLVKHLILKEVENEQYPTFVASESVERNTKKALEEYEKAVFTSDFFKTLNES
jgi:antitoxin component of RelBE/YafQ-DinJ toxin-antitoxin module